VTNAKVATNAVSTIKVVSEAITKIYSAQTSIPQAIAGTYTSLGGVTTNWSSVSSEVPANVVAIVSCNLYNVSGTVPDTIEFRLRVGSTNYDFYFQGVDPVTMPNTLATFQILYPTSGVTGNVVVEAFARNTFNPSNTIYAGNRAITLLGLKR